MSSYASALFVSPFIVAALPTGKQVLEVFLWVALAALVTFGGFSVAVAVRRWAQREERTPTFTIQDLRDMRARGQISHREFAAMRATLLAQWGMSESGEEPPAAASGGPPARPGPPES